MSRDWLFASVKFSSSTLPPTHVVRTFAPRVPRTRTIPDSPPVARAEASRTVCRPADRKEETRGSELFIDRPNGSGGTSIEERAREDRD